MINIIKACLHWIHSVAPFTREFLPGFNLLPVLEPIEFQSTNECGLSQSGLQSGLVGGVHTGGEYGLELSRKRGLLWLQKLCSNSPMEVGVEPTDLAESGL